MRQQCINCARCERHGTLGFYCILEVVGYNTPYPNTQYITHLTNKEVYSFNKCRYYQRRLK